MSETNSVETNPVERFVILRSGLFDKNGLEICLGDTIELHVPHRSEQTHYGENIPFPSGQYTEPLETEIRIEQLVVKFENGMFCINEYAPLYWDLVEYTSREELRIAFGGCRIWADDTAQGEDDLGYLLEQYPPNTEEELMKYVSGCEVIAI